MRVWHIWAIMTVGCAGTILYTRGIVDGIAMAGHADIIGWSWWKMVTLLVVGNAGLIAWSIVDLRKQ